MQRAFLYLLALALIGVQALAEEARPTAIYASPSQTLEKPLAALEAMKGKGLPVYSTSASGKELSQVEYAETWFDLPEPVNAQYLVFSAAPQTVHQITLGFRDSVKRDDIIAAATKSLGTPEQGKSDPDAPSQYFAQWVKDGVRDDLQDYGDYREMYIARARFSYAEQYKLKEPVFIYEQQIGKVKSKGKKQRIQLLCDGTGSELDKLWLYVCSPGKEAEGELFAIPYTFSGSRLDSASMKLVREADTKRDAIVVGTSATEWHGDIGHTMSGVFVFAEKDGKITWLDRNADAKRIKAVSGV